MYLKNDENVGWPTWQDPVQERGKKRVRIILEAARELIVEAGTADLKMTEVTKRAGIPVGSLYQFFPTRTDLLARLFEIEMDPINKALHESLARATSVQDLIDNVDYLMQTHTELLHERPYLFMITSTPAFDPEIRASANKIILNNAKALTDRAIELSERQNINHSELHAAASMLCYLWGPIMQLSFLDDTTGNLEAMRAQYVQMVQNHMRSVL